MTQLFILLFAYFVSFTDKPTKTAPQLSPRAVEQRAKWHITTDEMDYPVCGMYVDSLQRIGATVYHKSRWFNGVTVEMNATQAAKVAKWGFVRSVEMTRDDTTPSYAPLKRMKRQQEEAKNDQMAQDLTVNYTDAQLATYNLTPLHNLGYEGQGILMAVCDGAFYNANTLSCFRQSQELGHFDFTDDSKYGYTFYGSEGTHGTECLSTITGIMEGYYGSATQAQYYLMKSEEDDTESPKEMDNMVVALETADSLGVNIFSVSLGYTEFDNSSWTLPKTALNGKSTRASLAATIAARKGMLVFVAAGNDGTSSWRTICSPADADSILTVGAVTTDSVAGNFSSYGPSADGRVKPEVCAVGVRTTLIHPNGTIVTSNGTSFATPLMAGFAATLWSALPDENAMQIRDRIIRSAHLYPNNDPRNQMGYGIPDAWQAYQMDVPTGIEDVRSQNSEFRSQHSDFRSQKVLRDGKLYLMYKGQMYDVQGKIVH
jgi:subtilisin family serine protease